MNYGEIIKLLDAGYTREEILAMDAPAPADPEPAPADPKPEPADNTPDQLTTAIQEMKSAFAEMRKEITAMNIMSSRQPDPKTPEDIIANIINPNMKGDK